MSPADPPVDEREVLRAAKPAQDDPAAALMRANLRQRLLDVETAPVRLGRFTILRTIGRGGMGVVYAAYDDVLDRKIALKVLHESAGEAFDAVLREARALARLSHPHVVSVFEVGRDEGRPYIAMEFVDGVDLKQWLESERAPAEVLERLVEAGRGLAAAHEAGLCHGDFKPHNVLVGPTGAQVVDFGLARPVAAEQDDHAVGGTLLYLAPECLQGAPASEASDQYAFAATIYECLAGRPPFSAKTVAGLLDATKTPADLAALPVARRVAAAIGRALSADPAARFSSMEAMLRALQESPKSAHRWGVAALGLAAASSAVVHFATAPDPCDGGELRAREVWNATRSENVTKAWAAVEGAVPASAPATLFAALDGYVQGWADEHREACEATRVHGTQSDTMFDARMRCLDRRLSEVEALVEAAKSTTDASEVADVVVAATELTPVSSCEANPSLLSAHLRPDDLELAAKVEDVRDRLDRAWALYGLGRYPQARTVLQRAESEADGLDFEPLRPEVAFLGASLEARVGELDAAEHALRSCYERAVAVGNDRLAARVSLMLLRTVMFSSRPARVHDLAPFARADAARAHVPDAEIDSIVGEATLSEGDVDAAIAQLQRALEQETRPRRRALTMMTMASALLQRGETERAVEAYEGALQIVRDALGDDHPAVAFHMVRLGRGLRAAGRLDAASGVLDEAVERTRSLHGPDDRATASALLELGRLRAAQGRVEEARARLSEALAIRSAAYGPDHPRVADIETDLGDLERDGGSVAAARRHYQRALAIRQRATPDHPAVASLRQSIAALEESGGAAEEGLGVGEQGEVPTRGADVRP